MIEWSYNDTSHTYLGMVGEEEVAEIYGKDANYMSFWSIEQGTYPTVEAAKSKAEELFTEWLKKANLIPRSEIFSCEKCGDSGSTWSYYDGYEQCDCRDNPYSIYSLRAKI